MINIAKKKLDWKLHRKAWKSTQDIFTIYCKSLWVGTGIKNSKLIVLLVRNQLAQIKNNYCYRIFLHDIEKYCLSFKIIFKVCSKKMFNVNMQNSSTRFILLFIHSFIHSTASICYLLSISLCGGKTVSSRALSTAEWSRGKQ